MIAEAFGVGPNGLGEQPQVVAHTFGDDIKVAPRLFGLLPNFFSQPTKFEINLTKSLVDSLESPVDAPKPRVHGSFELGNRHRFTWSAHHSIVMYVCDDDATMELLEDRVFCVAMASADLSVANSSASRPADMSNRWRTI